MPRHVNSVIPRWGARSLSRPTTPRPRRASSSRASSSSRATVSAASSETSTRRARSEHGALGATHATHATHATCSPAGAHIALERCRGATGAAGKTGRDKGETRGRDGGEVGWGAVSCNVERARPCVPEESAGRTQLRGLGGQCVQAGILAVCVPGSRGTLHVRCRRGKST